MLLPPFLIDLISLAGNYLLILFPFFSDQQIYYKSGVKKTNLNYGPTKLFKPYFKKISP